ncbi:hypothetical protein V8C86DRAFT_3137606 [Haematococcus lacustris]
MVALNIAKTFPELAAAIEAYKQENEDFVTTPSSKSTARAGVVEDKGRFANDLVKLIVDCNLPFNIVDNPTFKTFYLCLQCLSPLVTRKVPMEFVDEVMELEQVFRMRMDYGHGLGTDASGNAARLELLDTRLEPEYAVGMGLKMDRFAPDLTADPVA